MSRTERTISVVAKLSHLLALHWHSSPPSPRPFFALGEGPDPKYGRQGPWDPCLLRIDGVGPLVTHPQAAGHTTLAPQQLQALVHPPPLYWSVRHRRPGPRNPGRPCPAALASAVVGVHRHCSAGHVCLSVPGIARPFLEASL
ncbi:MAG: hypothetical protein ACJ8DI_09335 [Ktedonobacteraceae bacterium]